jgi:hypothetical protein
MIIALLTTAAAVQTLRKPPTLRSPSPKWPPPDADPQAKWYASDAGPLGRLVDYACESAFRSSLAREAGGDDNTPGFDGIINLAQKLVAVEPRSAAATRVRARGVLRGLFPDWPPAPGAEQPGLLWWFTRLFARPFPEFSAKLNAKVTWAAGGWLMGPLELRDLEEESEVGDGTNQLVFVKRCRFLEQSGCASVCVNACKFPTQDLFNGDMGVPMRIEPDYETLSCSFKFGLAPSIDDEVDALATPCFSACPSGGALRAEHQQCPDVADTSLFLEQLTDEQRELVVDKIT